MPFIVVTNKNEGTQNDNVKAYMNLVEMKNTEPNCILMVAKQYVHYLH